MQVSKQIKSDSFELKLSATVNPKAYLATVFFEFDTTEKELLNALLYKYRQEKVVRVGFNPNNKIFSAIQGDCCLVITIPPEQIFQNIALLLSYLSKAEVKGDIKKYVSGKYDKMMKDIKTLDVKIVGKVKRFIATKLEKKENLDKFEEALGKVTKKEGRGELTKSSDKNIDIAIMKGTSDTARMYLSIILGDISCTFSKSGDNTKIKFYSNADLCKFKDIIGMKEKVVYLTQVRSFMTQSGTVGTPSAKDTDKKRFKEKVEGLMASENALAYIYSKLRGFSYKFKDESELKTDNEELNTAIHVTLEA